MSEPAKAAEPGPEKQVVGPPETDAAPSSISEAVNPGETQDFQPGGPKLAAAPTPPKDSPKTFGRYVVQRSLGSGAFGTVYLGHDQQLDRPVAIKSLRSDRALSGANQQEFLQEARRVAKLRHAGIVVVHDFGVQDDCVFIVSDYVAGTTLRERLRRHPFTWQESVRVAATLADALAHAHSLRVVHRDIKPANIIITADDKPILVDFGLGLDESGQTGEERGQVAGTPAYMSPEQAAGQGHRIDGRTDIYALGVILYEMLTGHVPFRAPTTDELLRQVREDEPQPPRQLVPHIPRGLEEICLKALAKRVGDRFTTAGDLAEELLRLLPGNRTPDSEASISLPAAPAKPDTRTLDSGRQRDASQTSVSASGRSREAERRQLTLLSCTCDLFDSAEFIEGLDAEEQHDTVRAYQECCATVVKQFGGTIVQMTEQATLACFGFPIAYEDSAARAIRTGLGILREIAALKERLARDKGIRFTIGLTAHTGMAVAGDASDGAGREALAVVGDARNVVNRLDRVARPDALVISENTYRLVHGFFRCESVGSTAIKGVAKPIEFFRVDGESDSQSRVDIAVPTGLTTLVGRDREVGLLQDRWEQAVEGMGQIVLLIGEAGLGKSRLVHVIKEHVTAESPGAERPVVEWRCTPHHQNSSLFPIIDYFERRLGFEPDEAPTARFEKLLAHLRSLDLEDEDHAPYLAALLSLPTEGKFGPSALSPAKQKEKTLQAVLDWLHASATKQPFLFVIEDLHWIDPSTLDLVARHVEGGLSDRILTLFTFRPEFETPWKSKAHQTVMALNRLTKKQIGAMMLQKIGVAELPPALVEQIAAKTDGVPLFVEEYTKMLMESDKLKNSAGDISVSSSFLTQQIPATLQDLLMARLDRMASNREVVQIAATVGREFSYELIHAVALMDETELQTELGKLVVAELLYQKGKAPHSSYLFKHALIQDAAYSSLLKSKKQQVHRRVATALETKFAETVKHQPELVAHHFTEAGLAAQAIDYWTKAGVRSQERFANAEAANHLRRGLELLATLPETLERAGQELALQIPLGTVLIASQGYAAPEVGPIFARARTLCLRLGQPVSLMAVLWGIWAWRVVREEFDLCLELANEMLELAESTGDDGMRMEAHFVPGLTLFYRADFTAARQHLETCLALYDAERCALWSRYTGQNCAATARSYLALSLWCLGYPDQAVAVANGGVKLARAVKHPFSQCYAIHHLGWLQEHLRLGQQAQTSAEANLVVANEQGFIFWKAVGTLCRASALLLQNKPAEALEQANQGLAIFRSTGAELSLGHYLGYVAEAHWRLHRCDEALKHLDAALAANARNRNDFCTPELLRVKGEILLTKSADNHVAAEACFQDALVLAQKQQAKSWELRTTMSLAGLWARQGRRAEARERLAAIYGWFTEGFSTPDLVDAKKLLDSLSEPEA